MIVALYLSIIYVPNNYITKISQIILILKTITYKFLKPTFYLCKK